MLRKLRRRYAVGAFALWSMSLALAAIVAFDGLPLRWVALLMPSLAAAVGCTLAYAALCALPVRFSSYILGATDFPGAPLHAVRNDEEQNRP